MPLQYLSEHTRNLRNRHFLMFDILLLALSPFLSLLIRFDWNFSHNIYFYPAVIYVLIFVPVKLMLFRLLGLYKRFWPSASIEDLSRILFIGINTVLFQIFLFGAMKMGGFETFTLLPGSLPFLDGFIGLTFIATTRFSVRIFERANERRPKVRPKNNVLIIGAGDAGVMIVQELRRNPQLDQNPIAFIDDDVAKIGMKIRGVPVVGNRSNIAAAVSKYKINKIIIAMPIAPGNVIKEIAAECRKVGVEVFTVPGIFEIIKGKVRIESLRKIQIEDLLRRPAVKIDEANVECLIKNKVVLITGAGGSIGSELCRQILNLNPAKMVLLGHGENSIFEIDQELTFRKSKLNGTNKTEIYSRIADIRNKSRLETIYHEFIPDIIFHAAAHKHVPLMELNPTEAISNNVMGTKNLVDLAVLFGIEHFILISSDKAVNPTNIMGTTKRICELILLDAAKKTGYNYAAVRFGNVLGSRGSVVHTFKNQIMQGGPITITHPDIKRFFMTIPEAVQLVLQASVLGRGGNVFTLDMGEPIKIIDLARDLIELYGLREGKDIEIKCTGLRPGEKLYEELFVSGETTKKTVHNKINIVQNATEFIPEDLEALIGELVTGSNGNRSKLCGKLKNIVPSYHAMVVN